VPAAELPPPVHSRRIRAISMAMALRAEEDVQVFQR